MRADPRRLAVAAAVVFLSVALSGCITAYPAKSLLSGPPGGVKPTMEVVVAYEREVTATTYPTTGTDARTIFVPPGSDRVTVTVFARISASIPVIDDVLPRTFDFTVADGEGTDWVDVHLINNSTQATVNVEGPRPGGWSVSLSYNLQGGLPIPADQFQVQVLVSQPLA